MSHGLTRFMTGHGLTWFMSGHGLTRFITGHGLIRFKTGHGQQWLCTVLLAVAFLFGCTRQELTPGERAAAVAKSCYEALYDGHPELFLDGRVGAEDMPQSYRDQLLEAYRRHVTQVNNQHRGVSSVRVSRAEMDSTLHLMQVFLVLGYGDNSQEEMVVPMVEQQGKWLMK